MMTKEEEKYLHELEESGVREYIVKQLREAFEYGLSKNKIEQEKDESLEEQIERARAVSRRRKDEEGKEKETISFSGKNREDLQKTEEQNMRLCNEMER